MKITASSKRIPGREQGGRRLARASGPPLFSRRPPPRVSPRAWVCENIPYRAQRFLCGGSRTLRRPLKTRLGLLERAIKPHFLPKSGRRIISQTRLREGCIPTMFDRPTRVSGSPPPQQEPRFSGTPHDGVPRRPPLGLTREPSGWSTFAAALRDGRTLAGRPLHRLTRRLSEFFLPLHASVPPRSQSECTSNTNLSGGRLEIGSGVSAAHA
jgi:hypothetical protein